MTARRARGSEGARAVIEDVRPSVDGGRFAAKRVVGRQPSSVEADASPTATTSSPARVRYRAPEARVARGADGAALGNDRWRASSRGRSAATATRSSRGSTTSSRGATTSRGVDPDDIRVALKVGAELIDAGERARRRLRLPRRRPCAPREPRRAMRRRARARRSTTTLVTRRALPATGVRDAAHPELAAGRRSACARASGVVRAVPALVRAGPGATARSATSRAAPVRRRDGLRRALPAADPPDRARVPQGPNNALVAGPDDVGSPWAIGASRRRAHGDPSRARHARGLSRASCRGRARTASRSRSTSRSSARPTIRG